MKIGSIVVATALCASACGRLGFDPRADVDGDGSVISDVRDSNPTLDGDADLTLTCVAGDGVCRQSCLATDPDCTTTCGDGVCIGNAGELCPTCAECNTTAPICGNGACDAGEDDDICFADCGPSPWSWTAQESDLLAKINAARAAGIDCGPSGPVTAPGLAQMANLMPASREWSWEFAHHQLDPNAPASCNGRSLQDRLANSGITGAYGAVAYVGGGATPQDALDSWIATPTLCAIVADAQHTMVGVGVAHDATRGFVVVFD